MVFFIEFTDLFFFFQSLHLNKFVLLFLHLIKNLKCWIFLNLLLLFN